MTNLSIRVEVSDYNCTGRVTYIREQLFGMAARLTSSDVTIKTYYDSVILKAEYDREGTWTQLPSPRNKTLYDVPDEDKAVALQALKELRDKNVNEWRDYMSAYIMASGVYNIDFGFTSNYRCVNDMTMTYAEEYSESGYPHLSEEEYSASWDEDEDEDGKDNV